MMVHSLVRASGLMSPSPSSSSSSSSSSTTREKGKGNRKGKKKQERRPLLVVKPHKASAKDLLAYHTKEYVDFVLSPSSEGEGVNVNEGLEKEMDETENEKAASFGLEDVRPPLHPKRK